MCDVGGGSGGPSTGEDCLVLPGDNSNGITTNASAVTANPIVDLQRNLEKKENAEWQLVAGFGGCFSKACRQSLHYGSTHLREGTGPRVSRPGATAALPNDVMARAVTASKPRREPIAAD